MHRECLKILADKCRKSDKQLTCPMCRTPVNDDYTTGSSVV